MEKEKIYKDIISMIGLEKEKDGFYHIGWGKKTEEGMIASIDNVLSPFVEKIEKYEHIMEENGKAIKLLNTQIRQRSLKVEDLKERVKASEAQQFAVEEYYQSKLKNKNIQIEELKNKNEEFDKKLLFDNDAEVMDYLDGLKEQGFYKE